MTRCDGKGKDKEGCSCAFCKQMSLWRIEWVTQKLGLAPNSPFGI